MSAIKMILGASGFMFIGDPHVSSKRPGRRKDKDFSKAILDKLTWCIEEANERNLQVVILGDLFDNPCEPSESLKARLARILLNAKHRVISIVGNHEKTHAKLSDDDTLSYMRTTGVMDLIDESAPFGVFDLNGTKVGLGGTPHGDQIPTSVEGMFGDVKAVIWITHHDLEFEGAYPNSMPTHEITGCKLVVNGHMHLTKKAKVHGQTTWFNPGNINRQAVDAMNHIPRVFVFHASGKLEALEVPHEKDVFDLTGRLVASISPDKKSADDIESAFVALIQNESIQDFAQTADGGVIREMIETKFESEATDIQIRGAVVDLLNMVVEAA